MINMKPSSKPQLKNLFPETVDEARILCGLIATHVAHKLQYKQARNTNPDTYEIELRASLTDKKNFWTRLSEETSTPSFLILYSSSPGMVYSPYAKGLKQFVDNLQLDA